MHYARLWRRGRMAPDVEVLPAGRCPWCSTSFAPAGWLDRLAAWRAHDCKRRPEPEPEPQRRAPPRPPRPAGAGPTYDVAAVMRRHRLRT